MSSDYTVFAHIPLKASVESLEAIQQALTEKVLALPRPGLTRRDFDAIFGGEVAGNYALLARMDNGCFVLRMRADFGGDHETCLALAEALTPLASEPCYLEVYDQEQAPSSDESMFLYELGDTEQQRRASRIQAAFDSALDIADKAFDPSQKDRLLKLLADFHRECAQADAAEAQA